MKNIQIDDSNSKTNKGIPTIEKLCKEIDNEYNNLCNTIMPIRTNSEYKFNYKINNQSPALYSSDDTSYYDLKGQNHYSIGNGNQVNPCRTLIMNKYLESIFNLGKIRNSKRQLNLQ